MCELAGRGMAILMISSELPEILGMSDRIAVMYGGTIVGVLDRETATQEAIMEWALGHVASDSGGGLMIGRYRRELSVAAAYVALLLVLAVAAPRFFRPEHLRDIVVSKSSVLVAAVGMTLVILCRHIDISIGSIFSICGVVAGLLSRAGLNIAVVVLGTLLAGSSLGAVNGVLVARLGLPSIVVTLATLVIWREALRYAREGEFVRNLPPGFQWFGAGQATGQWLVVAIALGVFLRFCLGPAPPCDRTSNLCNGVRSRGCPACGHPAPKRGVRRLCRSRCAGWTGRPAQRRPLRRC